MANLKLSSEVARFEPVKTPGQSCHTCLYRTGSECSKVNVTPLPSMVCRTWIPTTMVKSWPVNAQ